MLSNLLKKKKDSVKYFNKPKPCGIFFRCLNCPLPTPAHPPTLLFWLAFSQHFVFQCFVHLLSVCGFCHINLLVGIFSPLKLFSHSQGTHTQKSFSHIQQILLLWEFMTIILDIKAVHQPKNLFHRITILIHRSQIWTVSFYMTVFSGICQLVSIFTSGITSLVTRYGQFL